MEKEEYQYGFSDKDVTLFNSGKGLNKDVITFISKSKNEPEWMLEYRLKAYEYFQSQPLPSFGPNLSKVFLIVSGTSFQLLLTLSLGFIKYVKSLKSISVKSGPKLGNG